MKKNFFFSVLTFIVIFVSSSFAGTWINTPNTTTWYYLNDDNTFSKNTWVTYNGKYYYLDNNGIMLINTVTPDGYTVGVDGSWIETIEKKSERIITTDVEITSSSEKKRDLKNNIISKKDVEFVDSVKIGEKTWANVIKFLGDNSNVKANSGNYNRLTFEAGIKEQKDDVEYILTIFVNGNEAETIDEFNSDGEEISIDIDKNSEVMLVYNCVIESGTYLSTNNKALYIRKAQFENVRE